MSSLKDALEMKGSTKRIGEMGCTVESGVSDVRLEDRTHKGQQSDFFVILDDLCVTMSGSIDCTVPSPSPYIYCAVADTN